ncbi:hypothetical protein [Pseudonocardia sp.]|uniref:hypothetical protein n=1 Tax=Pseudonocardia sp. TaxID=60912 RepID=UPI0031FBC594
MRQVGAEHLQAGTHVLPALDHEVAEAEVVDHPDGGRIHPLQQAQRGRGAGDDGLACSSTRTLTPWPAARWAMSAKQLRAWANSSG